MLIKEEDVIAALNAANIKPSGVLHIGAHECEELPFYQRMGISQENVVWIDAIDEKVKQSKARGIPNVFKAVITDKDGDVVTFHRSNNVQSSSVLEFGTHAINHPGVRYVSDTLETTVTVDTFLEERGLDAKRYDFWNFDIQGAELMALKGAVNALQHVNALYLEVNTKEVYKGCGLIGEIDSFLGARGFKRVITDITNAHWGDALYIRRPKLSLCIPTMNRWSFLQENLPKYLENPHIDEIVISDENGADVEKIRETFSNPKLKLFVNKERLGPFLNKEKVVSYASNEWVALMDSDNFAPLSYFEAWNTYCDTHPLKNNIIYAPSRTIPTNTHHGFDYRSFINREVSKDTYRMLNTVLQTHDKNMLESILNTGNYIIHRDVYLAGNNASYSDLYTLVVSCDAKLKNWFLLEKGAVMVFPAGLEYYHVVHPGSSYLTNAHDIPKYEPRLNEMYNSFV